MEYTFKEIVSLILVIFLYCLPVILLGIFLYEFIGVIDNYNPIYSYINIYGEEKIVDYCGSFHGTFYCEDNGRKFYVDNYKVEDN